ncbi:MAG TPA: hypothetical protein VFG83_17195 [Kofleriaceae bacterium]|nr:hypothetical protein [Kofleriaceae bacterium]
MISTRLSCGLLACFLITGCGSDPSQGGGDGGGSDAPAGPVPVSVTIEPQAPTLTAGGASAATVDFSAHVTYDDGSEGEAATAFWTFNRTALGTMEVATGILTASGNEAGKGTVSVRVGDVTATTEVTVKVDKVVLGEGVTEEDAGRFSDAPATGAPESPVVDYPLTGAVMPSSVAAPLCQWENGAVGDFYRVVISAGLAQVTLYSSHTDTFNLAQPIDGPTWNMLIASAGGEPISFVVDRWSAADEMTYRSAPVDITVVDADVRGAIYYWDLSDGKIQRITDAGRDVVIPSPPKRPGDNKQCIACHTVSRDGRYMAAELWDGGDFSAVFDLTADLTADPVPMTVQPTKYKAQFQTFNPDATRLLTAEGSSASGSGLFLRDAKTGALVPSTGTPLPAAHTSHPTWSPDGSLIAYIANTDGTWAVDFTVGDLAVIPVTGADAFGPSQVLVPGAGKAASWPSFSPDSQWIAFALGVNSRGRNAAGTIFPGSLYLVSRDGGAPVALANANGGQENSHLANFSPFTSGGYFWLLFYTIRDYGNAQAGTKGAQRRQMWVTAIDATPEPGQDPSHVPYWLPGQDVATQNMSGFWTLAPPPE